MGVNHERHPIISVKLPNVCLTDGVQIENDHCWFVYTGFTLRTARYKTLLTWICGLGSFPQGKAWEIDAVLHEIYSDNSFAKSP